MAKVRAPLLSFGAGGQIAQVQVYASWKGRPYARQYVIPANPNTAAQQSTRNVFIAANRLWKTAPALLTAPWDRFATGQVLTGRNAFASSYISSLRGQVDMTNLVFSPGAKGGLVAAGIAVTPGVDTLTVDLTAPPLPSGWTIQAGVAAAIPDDDPAAPASFTITAGEDLATPFSIALAGLTVAGLYRVGGWFRYLKPDSTIAYGASLQASGTPT